MHQGLSKPKISHVQEESHQVWIYALSDPSNPKLPLYIGRTKRHPKRRLYQHMSDIFRIPNSPISRWLKTLDSLGKLPVLSIYEKVNSNDGPEREHFWTSFFRPLGCLLNIKTGDYGSTGNKHGVIGSCNGQSKLCELTVGIMRSLHFTNGAGIGAIGRKFGVTTMTASMAINRKTWKHVKY